VKARNPIPAATLVLGTTLAAPTMASISTGNHGVDMRSALGNGGVRLDGGVATLSGNVDGVSTKARVRQAALANADVERVVDLLTH